MYFFFSYSRQNNDSFLREFFSDLNGAVKELVGEKADAGFFDQKGLEPGDFWEKELEEALVASRVFIAAVTAGYAKSEYCGKEWAAFDARLNTFAAQRKTELPRLILPILWVQSMAPLPEEVKERQYTIGNPEDDYNKSGLKRLYQLKQRYEVERTNYLEVLATKIVALYNEHAALDQITEVPQLKDIPPAFGAAATASAPAESAAVKGPKRVHFIFGAGKPTEVAQAGKKIVEPYGGSGGEDWQPYFPSAKKIGSIARQTATADELNLWPGQLEISPILPARIRDAESQRELVVMFVDSWTAALPQYRATLQAFDRENYFNCSVIVPWNDADPDTQNNDKKLMGALNAALQFRSRNQNDLYYRAPIKTEEDLRKQLVDVLTRLRAEIINKSIPDPGVIPASGGGQPSITGPGK